MTRPILVAALLATALPLAVQPPAAMAQSAPAPTIRQADAERLAGLDTATGAALRQLVVEGDAAHLALARLALTETDGRWVYLGSTFVAGEQPMDYANFPEVVDTSAGETLPDVGVFEVTGPDSARILFPQPYRESILNVLTLTR